MITAKDLQLVQCTRINTVDEWSASRLHLYGKSRSAKRYPFGYMVDCTPSDCWIPAARYRFLVLPGVEQAKSPFHTYRTTVILDHILCCWYRKAIGVSHTRYSKQRHTTDGFWLGCCWSDSISFGFWRDWSFNSELSIRSRNWSRINRPH